MKRLRLGRGTTPIYVITFNGIDIDELGDIYLTFRQRKRGRILTKHSPELVIGDGYAYVQLTQKETLSFSAGEGEVQVRFTDQTGNAYKTMVIGMDVSEVLHERVIA